MDVSTSSLRPVSIEALAKIGAEYESCATPTAASSTWPHRHRYEFKREYERVPTGGGLRLTGTHARRNLRRDPARLNWPETVSYFVDTVVEGKRTNAVLPDVLFGDRLLLVATARPSLAPTCRNSSPKP